MHVIAINGMRVRCDWRTLHQLLSSGRVNGMLILVAMAMAAYKPTLFDLPTPYLNRIIFWVIAVHALLQRLRIEIAVFCYLVTALATVGAIYTSTVLIGFLSENTLRPEHLTKADFLRNLLIAGLVELLIATSILPFFWSDPTSEAEWDGLAPSPQPTTIRFEDRDIPLASLLHVQSQEHYLEFVFDQTKFLLRGALKDFVALCDHTHGIQCHRSHWVAKKAVTGRKRHDGNPVLQLSNGTSVPIARGRLAHVKTWLAQHRPEI